MIWVVLIFWDCYLTHLATTSNNPRFAILTINNGMVLFFIIAHGFSIWMLVKSPFVIQWILKDFLKNYNFA